MARVIWAVRWSQFKRSIKNKPAKCLKHGSEVYPEPFKNWTYTQNPFTTVTKSGYEDGALPFTSTTHGNQDDNPTDPRKLNVPGVLGSKR